MSDYLEDQESMCERLDRDVAAMREQLDRIQAGLAILVDMEADMRSIAGVLAQVGQLTEAFAEGGLPALMRMR